jgi:predicted glycoside hydrolase/deacetylase ChbG (UPF0249 family)
MLELSVEYNCAIRYPFTEITREIEETSRHVPDLMKEFNPHKPDTFIRKFYDDGATKESLIDIINNVEDGVSELMCHPGYVDEAFATESIYNFQREREFEILTDPSIKQLLESNQIELISFEDL